MDKFDDISLVTQVAVFHNRQSFDKLVRKYQSPVRRFLLNQTGGDSQLSDDLAQDTFMKAYTRIGQFQGKASFLTWLYRIAYNVYYDYMRSLHSTQDIDAVPASARAKGNSDCELKMDLQGALGVLSHNERVCITLQLIEGQPVDKIALITKMPVNTVKSHLARGKKKLVAYLKDNGYHE